MFSVLIHPKIYGDNAGQLGRSQNVTQKLVSYSHTINARLGFDTARIGLAYDDEIVVYLANYGLMSDIEVLDDAMTHAWNGYVSRVIINRGPRAVTLSSDDLSNKIRVRYTNEVDNQSTISAAATDIDSQDRYGTFESVFSAGRTSSALAIKIRDMLIDDKAWTTLGQAYGQGGDSTVIQIECKGYIHRLNDVLYYSAETATETVRANLIRMLESLSAISYDAGVFSDDYANLETHDLQISRYDVNYRPALARIKELTSIGGDSDDIRRVFGIIENRLAYMQPIPTEVDYFQDTRTNQIRSKSGALIPGYMVRPGKFVQLIDAIDPTDFNSDLRQNRSIMFAEQVTFTAPNQIQIGESQVENLSQKLAKLGLKGS